MPRGKKNQNAAMKVKAPGAKQSIDKMKYEIANEFGVNLGPNASSRDNGLVGGEMTKRLIENSMNSRGRSSNNSSQSNKKRSAKKRSRKKSK